MNWIIFILILSSLLCRPNVRKETSNNGNLRKLKENFTIALGLSLLFGLGWAFGLLASSDLPGAVRYPAEWIFTLMTAFLGVYLFALYILRSAEARKFWKSRLLCQTKKKSLTGIPSTNSTSRATLGTLSSTVRSWGQSFKANTLTRVHRDISSSTLPRRPTSFSANPYSFSSIDRKRISTYMEPSSALENTTAMVTSPCLPRLEIELIHREDVEREGNSKEANPNLPSKLPVNLGVETESLFESMSFHDTCSRLSYSSQDEVDVDGSRQSNEEANSNLASKQPLSLDVETESLFESMSFHDTCSRLSYNAFSSQDEVDLDRQSNEEGNPKPVSTSDLLVNPDVETESFVETLSFHDNLSLLSYNSLSSQSDTSQSGTYGECFVVQNKHTEGSDIIPLYP